MEAVQDLLLYGRTGNPALQQIRSGHRVRDPWSLEQLLGEERLDLGGRQLRLR